MNLPWEKAVAVNIFGDTDEGCRTTKLANLTSDVPPDSSGMGCNRKCSSISKILLNHKCWTWHWPIKMKLYILSKWNKIFDFNILHKNAYVDYNGIIVPSGLRVNRRCFVLPWQANVNTNSPRLVSLCLTRKSPSFPKIHKIRLHKYLFTSYINEAFNHMILSIFYQIDCDLKN